MRVDDVESGGLGAGGWGLGARKEIGLEKGDSVEAPGRVSEFVDELDFGGRCRAVFFDEIAAVLLVRGWVFGRENSRPAGQAVRESIERGTLLTGFGSRAGGMLGIRAIDYVAVDRGVWGCSSCS